MNNLTMFCLTLEPSHQKFIKELGYTPVGLGEKNLAIIIMNGLPINQA